MESVNATLEKRRLGRTGLEVTRLGLGTFRLTIDFGVFQDQALPLIDRAVSLGVNYIDTAPLYGSGESEELIGRVLVKHSDKQVIVSTKIGHFDRTVARTAGDDAYQNEDCIRRVIDHSLWLLQKDHLEMVFIHEPEWELWGWDEKTRTCPSLHVLEKLKDEKVIGAIGLGSNFVDFPGRLAETGRFDVVEIANGYTLMSHGIQERILPAAEKHDLGIVAGGPFRAGMLATKNYERLEQLKKAEKPSRWYTEKAHDRLLRLYDLSDETGLPMHEMSLRYILSNPNIHSVIPGAQNPVEVDANYQAALKGPLPLDVLAAIEKIQEETLE